MQFLRFVDKSACNEVTLSFIDGIFSEKDYYMINEWLKENTNNYYVLFNNCVLFTNDDDVTLFSLTWSDQWH